MSDEDKKIPHPMPRQKSLFPTFLAGCVVVSGALLVVGLFIGWYVYQSLDQMSAGLRSDFHAAYQELEASGGIPNTVPDDFEALRTYIGQDETGILGIVLARTALLSAVEDGAIDEEESALITATKEFLDREPAPNPADYKAFLQAHPTLATQVEQANTPHAPEMNE